jgi:hypothetical protein
VLSALLVDDDAADLLAPVPISLAWRSGIRFALAGADDFSRTIADDETGTAAVDGLSTSSRPSIPRDGVAG